MGYGRWVGCWEGGEQEKFYKGNGIVLSFQGPSYTCMAGRAVQIEATACKKLFEIRHYESRMLFVPCVGNSDEF